MLQLAKPQIIPCAMIPIDYIYSVQALKNPKRVRKGGEKWRMAQRVKRIQVVQHRFCTKNKNWKDIFSEFLIL
jgi:hypothetical protein